MIWVLLGEKGACHLREYQVINLETWFYKLWKMECISECKDLRVNYQRENKPSFPPCPLPPEFGRGSKFICASINLIVYYKCTHFKYGCISFYITVF